MGEIEGEEWQGRITTVKLQSQNIRGDLPILRAGAVDCIKKGEIESIGIRCSLLCLIHAAMVFQLWWAEIDPFHLICFFMGIGLKKKKHTNKKMYNCYRKGSRK